MGRQQAILDLVVPNTLVEFRERRPELGVLATRDALNWYKRKVRLHLFVFS